MTKEQRIARHREWLRGRDHETVLAGFLGFAVTLGQAGAGEDVRGRFEAYRREVLGRMRFDTTER